MVNSEPGAKDGSSVYDRSNIANKEEREGTRNTVEEFLNEHPPSLAHNQMCMDHPTEFIVAYNKLTYYQLCVKCIAGQNLQKDYY